MLQDLEGSVRKLAKFLDIELTDGQVKAVADANTFASTVSKHGHNLLYRKGWLTIILCSNAAM